MALLPTQKTSPFHRWPATTTRRRRRHPRGAFSMLRRSNCTLAASASSRHGSSSGLRRSSPTLETTGRCVCVWRLATREMRDERDIYVYLHPLEPQPRNLCSAILSSVSQLNSSALVNTYTQWSPPISPISTLVYTYTHFSPPISQLYLPVYQPYLSTLCITQCASSTPRRRRLNWQSWVRKSGSCGAM